MDRFESDTRRMEAEIGVLKFFGGRRRRLSGVERDFEGEMGETRRTVIPHPTSEVSLPSLNEFFAPGHESAKDS